MMQRQGNKNWTWNWWLAWCVWEEACDDLFDDGTQGDDDE
jgi:hypothetical protein